MRVSVALCTYNGERFIEEQLRSILAQDRPVDEIVVSDDGSSDGIIALVRQVLGETQQSGAPAVSIHSGRRGITRNFEFAVSSCTGDVIFLCDQDDVWEPQKVRTLLAALGDRADRLLAFSDALLVDADNRPLGRRQFEATRLGRRELEMLRSERALELLLSRSVVTGATVCFRRELLRWALPFSPAWLHDEWLAAVAASFGRLAPVDAPLTRYRQHGANQCGMGAQSVMQGTRDVVEGRRQGTAGQFHARVQALAERLEVHRQAVQPASVQTLQRRLAFEARRAALPAARLPRAFAVASLALRGAYARWPDALRTLAKDMLRGAPGGGA